jgi:hypothetical protein
VLNRFPSDAHCVRHAVEPVLHSFNDMRWPHKIGQGFKLFPLR